MNFFLAPFFPTTDFDPLFTDAAGSVGYGVYLHPHWFNGKWLPLHCLELSPGISITWQELFPIYLACAVWGPFWCNRHIHFSCNNQGLIRSLAYWLLHSGIPDQYLTSKVSENLCGSLALATRRTCASGKKQFILFCLKYGLVTQSTPLLPAREVTLIYVVSYLAD